MIHELSRSILKQIEGANFNNSGVATLQIENATNVDDVKTALAELKKLKEFSDCKFDLNEGTLSFSLYDPTEDIDSFATRHPNRTSCGGPKA